MSVIGVVYLVVNTVLIGPLNDWGQKRPKQHGSGNKSNEGVYCWGVWGNMCSAFGPPPGHNKGTYCVHGLQKEITNFRKSGLWNEPSFALRPLLLVQSIKSFKISLPQQGKARKLRAQLSALTPICGSLPTCQLLD